MGGISLRLQPFYPQLKSAMLNGEELYKGLAGVVLLHTDTVYPALFLTSLRNAVSLLIIYCNKEGFTSLRCFLTIILFSVFGSFMHTCILMLAGYIYSSHRTCKFCVCIMLSRGQILPERQN